MMRILSYYWPGSIGSYVYMLQQVEYNPKFFLNWILSCPNLFIVAHRKKLDKTGSAKLLLIFGYALGIFSLAWIGYLCWLGLYLIASLMLLVMPLIVIDGLAFAVLAMQPIIAHKQAKEIALATKRLLKHKAIKVAVIGSFGKTTMKEVLATVLAETKKVQATPGNKNVAISHARWVNDRVEDDSEVLIFEYGEAKPGDIVELANISKPDYVFITGYAPNHLDGYVTEDALIADLKSITAYVDGDNIYILDQAKKVTNINGIEYSSTKIEEWSLRQNQSDLMGLRFNLKNKKESLTLHSQLIGAHLIPVLSVVAIFALKIGLSKDEVTNGITRTKPFEHRMQPRQLHGGWIIDDTYNGNLEGVRAGLKLLKEIEAKRKIYVTPGLVEQGDKTQQVHEEIGQLIAVCNPDIVVLMKNSATDFIINGLKDADFKGELKLESDPLGYYQNIEHVIAGGDVMLMQNDWTDNYH